MSLVLLLSLLLTQVPAPRTEGGAVVGTVRQADGKPAVKVRVAAMPTMEAVIAPGKDSILVAISQTDESGQYRLENVPAGRYYIVAGRVDAPTYYPGHADVAAATIVTVTAGAEAGGIDFVVSADSLRPPPRTSPDVTGQILQQLQWAFRSPSITTVAGRMIVEPAGAPLPDRVVLEARMTSTKFPSSAATALKVAADGTFSVTLENGNTNIALRPLPPGYSLKSMTSGSIDLLAQPVTVRQGMDEIVIVLTADVRPRFAVRGDVMEKATGERLLGEPIELISESGARVRIIVDAAGHFEFTRLLPGTYTVRLDAAGFVLPEQRITITDGDVNLNLRATPR